MEAFDIPKIYENVKPRIVGRDKELKEILAALKTARNVVLEGPPGTSKSTILREVTRQIHIPLRIVEGSAELTPGKLVGTHNPAKVLAEGYSQDAFDPGPLTDAMLSGGFLYIEEFNRVPEDVMNVLLRAMDEKRIAIPRVGELQAKTSFRIVGAMNPFDDVGTERLSRAISDRLCRVELDYQSEEEEVKIAHLVTGTTSSTLSRLAVRLIRKTREHPDLKMGASVRGAIDMVLIAQERLRMDGLSISDDPLCPSDPWVQEILLDCAIVALSSKVWVSETSDRKAKEIIKEIWDDLHRVPLPGLPDGKIMPGGTDPGDDTPALPTSHSSPESEPSGKKKTDGVGRKPSHSSQATTAEIFGITVAQKEYLGEDWDPHVPIEGKDIPHVFRERLKREEKTAEREEAKKLAEKIIVILSQRERGLERRRGKFTPLSYRYDSAEIDIDRTLERMVGNEAIDYQDFIVHERLREKKAYTLILDVSGSMRGEGIVRALVALATFVKTVSHSDYAVLTFCDQASILKPMGQRRNLGYLIKEIFTVPTDGMTDIASGLKEGLRQLHKSRGDKRIGIILTDGAHNKHSDPFVLARQYPQLHVVGVRPPWPAARQTCERLARLGKGGCVVLNEIEEIPRAIKSLLS